MRQLLAHGDYPNISNCRTKILAIFRGYVYNFFAVFQNSYVFSPLFLSEFLTTFSGTLSFRGTQFQKHWSNTIYIWNAQNFQTTRGSLQNSILIATVQNLVARATWRPYVYSPLHSNSNHGSSIKRNISERVSNWYTECPMKRPSKLLLLNFLKISH
jgi:hypothetical protein